MAERLGPALRPTEIEMLLKGALNKNTERATIVRLRAVISQEREGSGFKLRHVLSSSAERIFLSVLLVGSTTEDWSGV